jgi:hypothetical protein
MRSLGRSTERKLAQIAFHTANLVEASTIHTNFDDFDLEAVRGHPYRYIPVWKKREIIDVHYPPEVSPHSR